MDDIQLGTVVGVFNDERSAQQAVRELESQGFTHEQIGYAVRHWASAPDPNAIAYKTGTASTTDTITTNTSYEQRGGTREGLVMGGITGVALGSIVGAAVALLIPGIGPVIAGGILGAALTGAAAGAATGGIAGALLRWGFSREEADYYHCQFEIGRTIVTVHADERRLGAEQILKRHGGYNLNYLSTQYDTSSSMAQF